MAGSTILGACKLIAFVPTRDIAKAREFYKSVLGLQLATNDAPVALVFDANGTMLRVAFADDDTPDPFTVLGWRVESIESTVDRLVSAGVPMLRYRGMNESDPRGFWTLPAGARVAWFQDPDQNVPSVTEFPRSAD